VRSERAALEHDVEQYFTLSKLFRHFARHSKGNPQVTQDRGAMPFLTFATRGCFATSPVLTKNREQLSNEDASGGECPARDPAT